MAGRSFTRRQDGPGHRVRAEHINELQAALEADDTRIDAMEGAVDSLPSMVEPIVANEFASRNLLAGPAIIRPVLVLSPDGSANQTGTVTPTMVGTVTTVPGTYGNAWAYAALADRMVVPNAGHLRRDRGSILVRARFGPVAVGSTQSIMNASSEGFRVMIFRGRSSSTANFLQFSIGNPRGTFTSGANAAPDDQLITAAITWQDGTARCFANGVLLGTVSFDAGAIDAANVWTSGSASAAGHQTETHLFFTQALSDQEVARLSALPSAHTINTTASEGIATVPASITRFVAPVGSGATSLELRASDNSATTIGVTPNKSLLVDGKEVGGPVGAEQIKAAAVTPEKTSFVSPGKNLYDVSAATPDVYISEANGTEVGFVGYLSSDYIPVVAGQPYTINVVRKTAFYDTNKTFVSGINHSQGTPKTVTPTVDGFLRFSYTTMGSNGTLPIQAEAGSSATAYEPYGLTLPDLRFTDAQRATVAGPQVVAPLTVTKVGQNHAISSELPGAGTLAISTSKNGSANGAFNLLNTTLNGTACHTTSDDITPIRTFTTVGANHGYTTISRYTMAGHGKTTADLGSVYTDGTRQYTLLRIDGNDLTFGHPYTVTDGVTTGVTTAPAATLTHMSGGTNTTSVPITSPVASSQLYPSANNVSVRYELDGRELTTDGEYLGQTLRVLESYNIMDYKALIDWARANVGQSFATAPIEGVVRIANVYTFSRQGRCTVSSSLTALKKVTLGRTGFLQSAAMSRAGHTLHRYMPGVKPKSGVDFSVPVDMTSYSTSLLFGPADYVDPAKPPSRYVDWLQSGPTKLVGFTMGYVSDKTNSKDSDRMDQPYAWDMRSTKKSYPVALEGVTLNAGEVRSIEGFRNYVAPHPSGATLVNVVEDAQAAYVHLDFHTSVTAQAIPLPDHIGKSVTVLSSDGLTVANDTVDASGLTVTVSGSAGRAVLKLM